MPSSGRSRPAIDVQGGGLARAVGSKDGEYLARGDTEFEVDAAAFDDGAHRHVGHRWLPGIRASCPEAAVAKAQHDDGGHHDEDQRKRHRGVGVTLPLEIDLQRQRSGDALA